MHGIVTVIYTQSVLYFDDQLHVVRKETQVSLVMEWRMYIGDLVYIRVMCMQLHKPPVD